MQCSKIMIAHRYQSHKVFTYQLWMSLKRMSHIFKYHSLFCPLVLDLMVDVFTIILSSCTCQIATLCLRYSKALKFGLDLRRYLISIRSRSDIIFGCFGIIHDLTEIKSTQVWSSCG